MIFCVVKSLCNERAQLFFGNRSEHQKWICFGIIIKRTTRQYLWHGDTQLPYSIEWINLYNASKPIGMKNEVNELLLHQTTQQCHESWIDNNNNNDNDKIIIIIANGRWWLIQMIHQWKIKFIKSILLFMANEIHYTQHTGMCTLYYYNVTCNGHRTLHSPEHFSILRSPGIELSVRSQ